LEKKKQALKAKKWSDIESKYSDGDEANLYLMANSEREEENEVNDSKLSYEEMKEF